MPFRATCNRAQRQRKKSILRQKIEKKEGSKSNVSASADDDDDDVGAASGGDGDAAGKKRRGDVRGDADDDAPEDAAREKLKEDRRLRKKNKRRGGAPPSDAAAPGDAPAADGRGRASSARPGPADAAPAAEDVVDVSRMLPNGVIVVDTVLGTGAAVVKHASAVEIKYDVWYTTATTKKEIKLDRATLGEPYAFVVGSSTVVLGLSFGVKGMRKHGQRVITVPFALGYGAKGQPPKVPPKAMLRFSVELLDVGTGFLV
ncbi:hypothetical protein M885DRAFT_545271 [Pelagophyceae sp. CCMP2097]|nr:hypothetical protein M885DRAFT_545271 [Pelagophyceae sp. CCMP2097]